MAEWSNAHAWKACEAAMSPWVRIPPCPPFLERITFKFTLHRPQPPIYGDLITLQSLKLPFKTSIGLLLELYPSSLKTNLGRQFTLADLGILRGNFTGFR